MTSLLSSPLISTIRTYTLSQLAPVAMKRHAEEDAEIGEAGRVAKRLRTEPQVQPETAIISPACEARLALQRSICLALDHVGFDTASAEALESFTAAVETCMCCVFSYCTLRGDGRHLSFEHAARYLFVAVADVFSY